MEKHCIADMVANLLGVFDVDWDKGFEDDGYDDVLALAPFTEPLWQTGRRRPPITVAPLPLEAAENG